MTNSFPSWNYFARIDVWISLMILRYGKSRGLSLLEVSVVIAVMGLLLGGVLYIVKNQKINSYASVAISSIDQLETATRMFVNTYGCQPGDCNVTTLKLDNGTGVTVLHGTGTGIVSDRAGFLNGTQSGNYVSVGSGCTFSSDSSQALREDVNALQQLSAAGFLAKSPSVISDNTSLVPISTSTCVISNVYNNNIVTTDNMATFYQKYMMPVSDSGLYIGIKTYNNLDLPSVYGVPTVTSVNYYNSAQIFNVTSIFIGVPSVINTQSLNILSIIDKKADDDTPLHGSMQTVFVSGVFLPGDTSVSFVRVANNNAQNAFANIYLLASFFGNNSNLPSFITSLFIVETGISSPVIQNMTTWSAVKANGVFNSTPVSGTPGAYTASSNMIVGVELVKPLYSIN